MEIGTQALHTYTVTLEDTAMRQGSGDLDVLSTPRLIAMIEEVAKNLMSSDLINTESSVGTYVTLQHLKASPIGAEVQIRVTLTEREGRKYNFTAEAYQGETLIAKGDHTRFVVDKSRFLAGLSR
ncbi:MAG: thioesterase family protein [Bacteroides sp.]